MVSSISRRTTRQEWKAIWRQKRIILRETSKAYTDLVIFGACATLVGEDVPDLIRHVPIVEFYDRMARA